MIALLFYRSESLEKGDDWGGAQESLYPGFDPGNQVCKSPGPHLGVVLTREEMGQFVAQGHKALARWIDHDTARFVEGFSQEKGGSIPVFFGVGQVIRVMPKMNRFLVKSPAEPLGPGFQVQEAQDFHEPVVIAVAAITPDLAVTDQVAMVLRI
jgi:hypothetical protein